MRNAVLLAGIWVGIIVFAYGVVYWGSGPTEIPYLPELPFTETVYADSGGRYEITLPAGWAAREEGVRTLIVGPERDIRGAVVMIAGIDPEAAVNDAWTFYRPDALPVPERVTVGSMFDTEGPDWHVAYRLPDEQAAVAKAYAGEGLIAVLIVEGPSEIMEKRASDIETLQVVLLEAETATPAVLDEEVEEADVGEAVEADGGLITEESESPEDGEGVLPADDVLPQQEELQTVSETVVDGVQEP